MASDEGSESTVVFTAEENEMPIIQLCGLVEDLSYGISALKTETGMFEKYYNKLEPRDKRHSRFSEIKMSGSEYAQKEEVGDALHEVDFQQLKIENAQFLETIEAKNNELVQLKLVSGNALQILSTHKSKLHRALELSSQLDKEIILRNELLEKVEKESIQAEEGRANAETLNKQLRKQLAEFRAPPVMMYVQEKIRNGELEKTIKMWERKVEIAELSLKGYRKIWNQIKIANEQLQVVGLLGNALKEDAEDSPKIIY
ncbi:coiled-coil domain-containing protein 113 [Suncus etruscus]|uniref:coiled-coil domain-containing protein 113 n=1 Tax=Suncus etruscus TaxID=109475 RepID=UPI00210F6DE7|nr:coiled-coil domain-containing protein 113 [Suncus etruscus]